MKSALLLQERYVDSWLAARSSPRTAARMAELLVTALEVVGTQGSYVLGDVMVEAICGRALAKAQLSLLSHTEWRITTTPSI